MQFGIVDLVETFKFRERDEEHMALVFETLGKSLYDFIKANNYKGMQDSFGLAFKLSA